MSFASELVKSVATTIEALELANKGRMSEARAHLAGAEPEPGVKQKDLTRDKSLRDVFLEACEPKRKAKAEPQELLSWASLAKTIKELEL